MGAFHTVSTHESLWRLSRTSPVLKPKALPRWNSRGVNGMRYCTPSQNAVLLVLETGTFTSPAAGHNRMSSPLTRPETHYQPQ